MPRFHMLQLDFLYAFASFTSYKDLVLLRLRCNNFIYSMTYLPWLFRVLIALEPCANLCFINIFLMNGCSFGTYFHHVKSSFCF